MPTAYTSIIVEATGCSPVEADRIEEFMRDEVFHSTLDWQTREELGEAARLAVQALQRIHHPPRLGHIPAARRAHGNSGGADITFRLTQSQALGLGAALWTLSEAVPGLRGWRAESAQPAGFRLTLWGSRRAIARAARIAGIARDVVQQAFAEHFGPGA